MAADESRIKLKIDLRSGTLELDALPADFELAIQRTKELAGSLQFGERPMPPLAASPAKSTINTGPQAGPVTASKSRDKPRSSGGKSPSSTGRPGRLGSFEPVRDLLTDAQHKEIYAYLRQKAPVDQEDQILCAVHKGEQLLGKQGFSYNEVYTLLWRAGVDPLPKAIDVVVQRLIQDQKMDKGESGYFMKFLGQSRVDSELPSSKDTS